MPSAVRSLRQEQRTLATGLRAERKTWVEIAAVFRERYGVNVRAALRMVRDWSQRDAAEQWNSRWPAEPKTFKNFSYWEIWPGPTGHAPSLDVLTRLAELYECSIADLVSDFADFRSCDPVRSESRGLIQIADVAGLSAKQSMDQPEGLVAKLESIDIPELARLTGEWSERLGAAPSRGALLLKLSAALSLAAASSTLEDDAATQFQRTVVPVAGGFSGIWHSQYTYPSSGRAGDFVGEHYVVFRQHGNRLVGQSLPHSSGSRLRIELAIDGSVATGSWRETTSPGGYYKGATYHGTLQLIAEPSGHRMRGMWLGFGRDFVVNSGRWDLVLEDKSAEKSAQRAYHEKL